MHPRREVVNALLDSQSVKSDVEAETRGYDAHKKVTGRTNKDRGFVVQARRWIVERTHAWLSRERRMAKDYERKEKSSKTFVYLGMIRLMLGCLA